MYLFQSLELLSYLEYCSLQSDSTTRLVNRNLQRGEWLCRLDNMQASVGVKQGRCRFRLYSCSASSCLHSKRLVRSKVESEDTFVRKMNFLSWFASKCP